MGDTGAGDTIVLFSKIHSGCSDFHAAIMWPVRCFFNVEICRTFCIVKSHAYWCVIAVNPFLPYLHFVAGCWLPVWNAIKRLMSTNTFQPKYVICMRCTANYCHCSCRIQSHVLVPVPGRPRCLTPPLLCPSPCEQQCDDASSQRPPQLPVPHLLSQQTRVLITPAQEPPADGWTPASGASFGDDEEDNAK